jgi:hypothetical protein
VKAIILKQSGRRIQYGNKLKKISKRTKQGLNVRKAMAKLFKKKDIGKMPPIPLVKISSAA